jgi:hypothetical protein
MTFTDICEKLLICLYQDDQFSGAWHDLAGIQSKYGLPGDLKLLSLAAKHLADVGNINLRELVGAAIRGRLTGAGITYIEQKYGDKDGVGTIIELVSDIEGAFGKIVPASDRIVKLTDNQLALDVAVKAVLQLKNQLATGNDFGDLSLDELEVARREVYWIEHALKQESLRVEWIEPLATNCLKWITTKAAEQIVGTFAIAALAAIAALFGFPS